MVLDKLIKEANCLLLFFDDHGIVARQDKDQITLKQVDWTSAINALEQNYNSDWYFDQLRLHKLVKMGNKELSLSSIAPAIYHIKFEQYILKVPLPGAVIVHCSSQMWVLAYKDKLDKDTPLYHFPLPNINGTGKVCWGEIIPPKDRTTAWSEFINSTFNQDFNDGKSRTHINIIAKLSSLAIAGEEQYPLEDLIEAGFTPEELIKACV